MQAAKLQAWWAHKQGMDGRLRGESPQRVSNETGWVRSLGGVNPYLAMLARAGIGRVEVDQAIARLQVCELPAARGCTYVVPASDFGLALLVAQEFAGIEMKTAKKLHVTDADIDALCEVILEALEDGPLETSEIRDQTDFLVKDLGEVGRKKGLKTTLPVALGQLQVLGYIRREPINGRLDQQRFRYARWTTKVRPDRPTREEDYLELARRFFHWIGPASISEFKRFCGVNAETAARVTVALGLVALEEGDPRLMFAEDRQLLADFQVPGEPCYSLVGRLDGITHLRRDVKDLLAGEDHIRKVYTDKGIAELASLSNLSHHAILDRGRLIGLWEYDPSTSSIVWTSFVEKTEALEQAVRDTEQFVREQLGDARSFSLDSPKRHSPRIQALH
jgi:hypothetical protein